MSISTLKITLNSLYQSPWGYYFIDRENQIDREIDRKLDRKK